jgi:tetratricopeptide (TPR) repeat protein
MNAPYRTLAVTLTAVLAFSPATDALSDPVRVSASIRGDAGRLSLIWPEPIGFTASAGDGRFVLGFDRPVEADFARAADSLKRFVGTPRITDGGRSLTFPLMAGVTALTFADGKRVVVDLLAPSSLHRADAGSGDAAQAPAAEPPPVRVRRGEHRRFSRIVFDWTGPIDYRVTANGGELKVTFDKAARLDLTRLERRPLRNVRLVGAATGEGTSHVDLAVAEGADVRDFRQGTMVVIDVYPPSSDAESERKEAAPALAAVMTPVPAPNRSTAAGPTLLQGGASMLGEEGERGAAGDSDAAGITPRLLRFDWPEPVAAAVFRRGDTLWVVFDRPSLQDLAALHQAGGEVIRDLEQRPHPRATVLRMKLAAGWNATVQRDGLSWLIALDHEPKAEPIAVEPMLREDPGGRRSLVLPVAEPGAPLAVTDPDFADTLVLVPTVPLGYGIRRNYAYPELRLLASTQGFAIRPLVDDLRVRADRESVELTREGGLALTPIDEAIAARARLRLEGDDERLISNVAGCGSLRGFTRARQELEAALAAAEGIETRENMLLRLADLNLCHGFAAEALGALDLARLDRAEIEADARYHALRGAALVLLGRGTEAEGALSHPSLAGRVEPAAWRTALAIARGGDVEDGETLGAQASIVTDYPQVLRSALLPRLAEAAVDAGDAPLAAKLVALVSAEAHSAGEKAQAKFLEGRRLAANGDVPGALAKWREVEAGPDPDRRSRVRAAEARVALALAEKRMDVSEAIDALDSLSFGWRGDALEFDILRRLGDLHLARGDYPSALRTLRRAATNFPGAAQAAEIPAKMTRAFAALFVGKDADARAPLEAIALYDEFRELTPAGARGDAVVSAVARRMVALDLLGRAAALLDSQVRYRLVGVERARTGSRLASIYLLDSKPQAALDTLQMTAQDGLPSALVAERRMIEVRALARLGRMVEALERLGAAETEETAAIRADISWALEDWRQAARSLAQVLAARGPGGSAKGSAQAPEPREGDADTALHLAVALALAGDEDGLARLNKAQAERMAASRWRDVFPLIVDGTMPAADLQALSRDLRPVDRFRAYLARGSAAER